MKIDMSNSDYCDIEFTKAYARRVDRTNEGENLYATVVVTNSEILLDKEKLYRIKCDHTVKQSTGKTTHVKLGDVFLGESEKEDQVFGTLLQKIGGTPKKINIDIKNLQLYQRDSSSRSEQVDDTVPADEEDIYVNNEELYTNVVRLDSITEKDSKKLPDSIKKPDSKKTSDSNGKPDSKKTPDSISKQDSNPKQDSNSKISHPPIAVKPTSPVPKEQPLSGGLLSDASDMEKCDKELFKLIGTNMIDIKNTKAVPPEKWKAIKEDKIPNLGLEYDKGIDVFAIGEIKKVNKEENRLVFKRYQTGKLVYAIKDWWYIKSGDLKGWVPYHFWRIIPENKQEEISSPDYLPWDKTSTPIFSVDKYFETSAVQNEFAMRRMDDNKRYDLMVKDAHSTMKFTLSIDPNNGHVTSVDGQVFKSVINYVIYYRRHNLPTTQSLKLGRPSILR